MPISSTELSLVKKQKMWPIQIIVLGLVPIVLFFFWLVFLYLVEIWVWIVLMWTRCRGGAGNGAVSLGNLSQFYIFNIYCSQCYYKPGPACLSAHGCRYCPRFYSPGAMCTVYNLFVVKCHLLWSRHCLSLQKVSLWYEGLMIRDNVFMD